MKYALIAAVAVAIAVGGCSQQQPGQNQAQKGAGNLSAAAASAPTLKLAALLSDPRPYVGKDVTVKGTFNGACCATDFILKDGFETMEVYITGQCPMPNESKKNSQMAVLGTVQLRGDEVSLIAKEVSFQ